MSKKQILLSLAGIFLLFALLLFLHSTHTRTLEQKILRLQTELSAVQQDLNSLYHQQNDQKDLEKRIAELEFSLKEAQNLPLVDTYSLELQEVDTASRTMSLKLQVKLNVKNTAAPAEAILYQGGLDTRFPLTQIQGEPGWYTSLLSFSLEDLSKEAYLQAAATDGGKHRAEELSRFNSVTELLEVSLGASRGSARYQDGCLTFTGWDPGLKNAAEGSAYINVYLNGELAQSLPIPSAPMTFTQSCAAGDKVVLRYTARDRWGLTYEFLGQWWKISETGAERHFPSSGKPTLIWPET